MNHSDDRQDLELLGLDSLPQGWKYIPLGELVDSRRGISYGIVQPGAHVNDGVPIIRVNNLQSGRIDANDIMKVSSDIENKYQRTRLKGGEVLLSLVGSLGQTAVVSKEILGWNVARAIAVIPVIPEISPEWVNFALRSPLLQHYIYVWATTTVQATLNLGDVVRLPIPVPPEKERKAIIDILGALDDKIELNRRMNQTLESMARAVFRQWFVENEDAEGWKVGTVGSVIKRISVGKKYDFKTALLEGEIPILDQAHFTVIGYHNDEPGVIASSNNPVIVFSNHRCYTDIIQFPFSAIQNVLPFVGEGVDTRWLYHATDGIIEYSEYKGHWPEFMSKPLVIPPEELTQKFGEFVKPMHIKIMKNKEESRTLASLLDRLLPKLMRGEVRVKE